MPMPATVKDRLKSHGPMRLVNEDRRYNKLVAFFWPLLRLSSVSSTLPASAHFWVGAGEASHTNPPP
jgi:hypothetical protein